MKKLVGILLLLLLIAGGLVWYFLAFRLDGLIREQIGPAAALVQEKDWPRLIATLGDVGLVPDVVALEDLPFSPTY